MRAIAIFTVFVIAKILVMFGHEIPFSGWTPIAYFWQDVMTAGAIWALDVAIKRAWLGWLLYGTAVVYVAFNVAVARVLSSPLTWSMMKAAGGALSDSIRHHATLANLGSMALVIAAGASLPRLLRRFEPLTMRPITIAAAVAVTVAVVLGPTATSRIDTIGLHRNAIATILVSTSLRSSASAATADDADWRESPFSDDRGHDELAMLRGAAAGRNVVLVLLESTGAAYLKPYGAKSDPMPRLTEFVRGAVVFESAYAVYPESIRTLFSIICGRYPNPSSLSMEIPHSLPAELKAGGYRTGLFHSGRFMYLGMEDVVRNKGYDVLEDAGEIGGQRESSFGVDEASTVRRMLLWIDSKPRSERFFLTYLPIAGHHPYDTPSPGPFPEREESDRYLNALDYSDASLHELIEGLRTRGLEEKTLFVIAGDHGEAFGQHDGNYGHSLFIYDENLRVPYFIVAPGLSGTEQRVKRPVSLVDTAPTILDLLGMEKPIGYQGSSMIGGRNQMALFFTDYSLSLFGLRDGCWKYIYEPGAGRSKLFNLCEDAGESRDCAGDHPERVNFYRQRIGKWGAQQTGM